MDVCYSFQNGSPVFTERKENVKLEFIFCQKCDWYYALTPTHTHPRIYDFWKDHRNVFWGQNRQPTYRALGPGCSHGGIHISWFSKEARWKIRICFRILTYKCFSKKCQRLPKTICHVCHGQSVTGVSDYVTRPPHPTDVSRIPRAFHIINIIIIYRVTYSTVWVWVSGAWSDHAGTGPNNVFKESTEYANTSHLAWSICWIEFAYNYCTTSRGKQSTRNCVLPYDVERGLRS